MPCRSKTLLAAVVAEAVVAQTNPRLRAGVVEVAEVV
jgi:hypothetical protein